MSPYGAPGNFIPWTVRAGTFFKVTERPPNRFAEPGRICSAVTPPLASAREKYSAEHPDVVRLQRQIENLEASAAKAPTGNKSQRHADNPAYITLQAQLNATDNEIQALRGKQAELEKKRAAYEQRLIAVPQVEGEFRTLTRELENATLKYQEVKSKQMQAQMAQQLETESKGERFTLIDPPILPEEPISPNRPAILFLSLILALGTGIGYAAIAENVDVTVRGAKGVVMALQAAPLAVIPYMATDAETAARRRHRRILVLGAAGVVVLAVTLVHFLVSPLDVLWFRALRKATRMTGIGLE